MVATLERDTQYFIPQPYLKHLLKVRLAEGEHVHVSDSSHRGLHGGVVDEALLAEVATLLQYLGHQLGVILIQYFHLRGKMVAMLWSWQWYVADNRYAQFLVVIQKTKMEHGSII